MKESRKSKRKKRKHRGGFREGAGRKPIAPGGTVTFSGTVPVNLAGLVDTERGEQTRSAVLREALSMWIDSQK